jgi:hypothetical protein
MLFAHQSVIKSVHAVLSIARETLLREGSHLPTAILHTLEGLFPIVLPFKDDDQKKALMEVVKKQAIEQHAFAVTAITCGRIIDSRTGEEEESLVIATAIQGGSPHVIVQSYVRGPDRRVIAFGDVTEGDAAAMPGQMMIVPPWEEETRH